MYLTSITQRERLYQIATRWFGDRMDDEDGKFITQVFLYESLIWAPIIRRFFSDIFRQMEYGSIQLQRLHTKDALRDRLCQAYHGLTPRATDLFERYKMYPEEYFPGTPTEVTLALDPEGRPLGMIRVKRVRRIAEKASRRVADFLALRIRRTAQDFAAERAAARGVSLDQLVSTPDDMFEDFARAERKISRAFREESLVFEPKALRVDDVIGIKFIGQEEDLRRIESIIAGHPRVAAVEREEHHGTYNDINLLIDLELPSPDAIIKAAQGHDWGSAGGRGVEPSVLAEEFPQYVESGARTVRAEVILTTCEELIESEFGRSIHEQRILEQRQSVPYSGRIAGNAGFLIEYLLMLALSPRTKVSEIPIKMWGRYLPDVFSAAVWDLFDISLGYGVGHALAEIKYEWPE